jgi:hypothetical protein
MCPTIECDDDDNIGIKLGSEFYKDTMTSDRIAEQTAKAIEAIDNIEGEIFVSFLKRNTSTLEDTIEKLLDKAQNYFETCENKVQEQKYCNTFFKDFPEKEILLQHLSETSE